MDISTRELAYERARAEWLAAIAARRPHHVVKALWDTVVALSHKLDVIPGSPVR